MTLCFDAAGSTTLNTRHKWFGSYDLALIPVACTLAVAALAWLRIDATELLIPEEHSESVPETAILALG